LPQLGKGLDPDCAGRAFFDSLCARSVIRSNEDGPAMTTLREHEQRTQRRKKQHSTYRPTEGPLSLQHDNQVLTFRQWCALNGFSPRTGRRILDAPDGPEIVRLSPRRIGITIHANREWQESRTRKAT
jgi:hypothetical protein